MKKVLLTFLAVIVVAGALAGAGYAGYRIGYNQGAVGSGNVPFFGRTERMNPNIMPHNFDRDFNNRMQPFRSPMIGRGNSFGYFTPFMFLGRIIFWALAIWFAYWLFTKSGWRITRQDNKEQNVPEVKTEG